MTEASTLDLTELTADIVAAYVTHNAVSPDNIPGLLKSVHAALAALSGATPAASAEAPLNPPVSIRKSVTDEALISLEDGQPYVSLKRHLAVRGLTPEEYRAKWGLPADYPMVAPAYSRARSEMAKTIGLGRKPGDKRNGRAKKK